MGPGRACGAPANGFSGAAGALRKIPHLAGAALVRDKTPG